LVTVLVPPGGVAAETAPSGRGRILFLACQSCHDLKPGPSPKTGPSLYGVVGRKAGALAGYAYSPAMKAQTFVWDEATLNRWLTAPTDLVPGTKMAFAGLPKAEDRAAVIEYLKRAGP
jgi:cytochrome c